MKIDQGKYQNADLVEDVLLQGNYGRHETVESWTCPNCETINIGDVCFLCGYQCKQTAPSDIRKKKRYTMVIAASIVLLLVTCIWFGNQYQRTKRYENACIYLQQHQYSEACELFDGLKEYRDSQEMYQQATYAWAEYLLEREQFDQTLEKLKEIPDYEKTAGLTHEAHYQKSLDLLEREEYAAAYCELLKTPVQYKNRTKYLSDIKVNWGKYIIDNALSGEVAIFSKTVILTKEESDAIYLHLKSKDYDILDNNYYGPSYFLTCSYMLDTLSEDYLLKEFYNAFSYGFNSTNFIKENRTMLSKLWDTPVVRNFIMRDDYLEMWMLGIWKATNGQYIKFYEEDSYVKAEYTLPTPRVPAGAKYYDFINMEFIWKDGDHNELTKVYRFKLLGPDTMEVYCYVNGQTYTVYRTE